MKRELRLERKGRTGTREADLSVCSRSVAVLLPLTQCPDFLAKLNFKLSKLIVILDSLIIYKYDLDQVHFLLKIFSVKYARCLYTHKSVTL